MKYLKSITTIITIFAVLGGTLGFVYAFTATKANINGVITYTPDSGIRYNSNMDVFEVFSYEGLSWVAQDKWVSTSGKTSSVHPGDTEVWEMATADKTYNIMRDINYTSSPDNTFNSEYTINITFRGIFDGRGHFLKNFATRNISGNAYSILFNKNEGTIRDIKISDPVINSSSGNHSFLVYENSANGLLDNCTVRGDMNVSSSINVGILSYIIKDNAVISNSQNNIDLIGSASVGGICNRIESGSPRLINNTNYGILEGEQYAGGIVSYTFEAITAEIYNNTNYGSIESVGFAAGIIGFLNSHLSTKPEINGNINNGSIISKNTVFGACGIGAGKNRNDYVHLNQRNNLNYGPLSSVSGIDSHQLFYGYGDLAYIPVASGIRYNGTVFEIYTFEGFNQLGSYNWVSDNGDIQTTQKDSSYQQATLSATYVLMNDIDYNLTKDTRAANSSFDGVLDGRGFKLNNFRTKLSSGYNYAILFYSLDGSIKNLTMNNPILGGGTTTNSYQSFFVFNMYNNASIFNCHIYGNDLTYNLSSNIIYLGMFANQMHHASSISYCTNNLNIRLNGDITRIGGIAYQGQLNARVAFNENNGNLTASAYAGGIVCYVSTTLTVEGNVNNGNINTTASGLAYSGGIIAYLPGDAKATVIYNINYGSVTSKGTVSACGIASSNIQNNVFTHRGNRNYGILTNTNVGTRPLFFGHSFTED